MREIIAVPLYVQPSAQFAALLNRALSVNAVELTVSHPALTDFYMDLVTAKTKLAEVGFNQDGGHTAVSLSPSGLLAFFLHPESRPALGGGLDMVREMVSKLNACQNKFREDCGDWD